MKRCELGLIDRMPRLAVVQASGAAPFARAFRSGELSCRSARKRPRPRSRSARPRRGKGARRSARPRRHRARRRRRRDRRCARGRRPRRRRVRTRFGGLARRAAQLRAGGTIAADDDVVLVLTGPRAQGRRLCRALSRRTRRSPTASSRADEKRLRALIDRIAAPLRRAFGVSVPASSANLGPGFERSASHWTSRSERACSRRKLSASRSTAARRSRRIPASNPKCCAASISSWARHRDRTSRSRCRTTFRSVRDWARAPQGPCSA